MNFNDCLYCHKPITSENYSFDHVHYCTDCVKICIECNELKGVWAFGFNYESEHYKKWKRLGAYGHMTHEGHKDICLSCEEKLNKPEPIAPALLQLMLDAVRKTKE